MLGVVWNTRPTPCPARACVCVRAHTHTYRAHMHFHMSFGVSNSALGGWHEEERERKSALAITEHAPCSSFLLGRHQKLQQLQLLWVRTRLHTK